MSSTSPKKISVVICTHNRAYYLPSLIDSLQAQTYPPEGYEIIVVDNASGDNTCQVVEELQREGMALRYIYEPTLGLNYARNTGAKAAVGDIVAYIDDDAIAEIEWLTCLEEAYHRLPADVVCVGGTVELVWDEGQRPSWLARELEGYYSGTAQFGSAPRFLHPGECPIGANFSVRRRPLLDLGGFPISLGRTGKSLLSNAEVSLCAKVYEAGLRTYFEPSARVYHRVPAVRARKQWLLRRTYWQGISDALLVWDNENPSRLTLIKRSMVNLVFAFSEVWSAIFSRLKGKEQLSFVQLSYASARLGRLWKDLQLSVARN